jgi:uncharacterized lipoprotein NlpE involved in copper resistance
MDGSTIEKAIIINVKTEEDGTNFEYSWIRQHHPGYRMLQQALLFCKKIPYDRIDILDRQGNRVEIYFNISEYFGKF